VGDGSDTAAIITRAAVDSFMVAFY
jgi:hypothetical protein